MSYEAEINSSRKGCFLFLLDQSSGMDEPLGSSVQRKCDWLARTANGWLTDLTIRATSDKGIRDVFDVGMLGYRTDQSGNAVIQPVWQGRLAGRTLASIAEVGD